MMKISPRFKSDLILLFVAAIWGSGFVAQRFAASRLSAFYFNGGRFLLAGLLLLPLTRFVWRINRKQLPWIILAGALLAGGSCLQQAGLATTTISNASFITGLYVVMVPIILSVVLKKKITRLAWLATLMAVAGVALLSLQDGFKPAPGDILELIGAVVWALHVILVGKLAGQKVDVAWFAVIQFLTCGALSFLVGLAVDPHGLTGFAITWQAILFSAIIPVGLGFTLQMVGQRNAPTVDAAIILSMEAVFGAVFGYFLMNEGLNERQIMGCFLILAAMILAQLKPKEEQDFAAPAAPETFKPEPAPAFALEE